MPPELIDRAVAGPALNKRKLDKSEPIAENQQEESREKGPRKRRQITKLRLSGFEYDEDADGALVPVAMRFDELHGDGDDDSTYSAESEESTTTTSSSSTSSSSSSDEESDSDGEAEAQDVEKFLKQKLYNFDSYAANNK